MFKHFKWGTENSIEGSGFGLSIVRRIMNHLEWRLSYQPNAKRGSSLRIEYK